MKVFLAIIDAKNYKYVVMESIPDTGFIPVASGEFNKLESYSSTESIIQVLINCKAVDQRALEYFKMSPKALPFQLTIIKTMGSISITDVRS